MIQTFKTTAKKLEGGLQVQVGARNFNILIDEPPSLGGSDQGMTPVEALLGALGACQTIVAYSFAEAQGVSFKSFHIEVEGDLDPDGFLDKADVRNGFQEIRYRMHFETDEPADKIEKFARFIESHCPVGDTLAEGTPLKLTKIILR